MAECERCGRKGRLQLVDIAGARMYVCSDCSRFGKKVREQRESAPEPSARPKVHRPPKPDVV